ncbi:MAG: PAS domain S-box protein, partial [Burkholderiales bacterium]|nr:PAS domain S-box protein [Burkholderiales bacterium]
MIPPRHLTVPAAVASAAALTLLAGGLQWLLWPHIPQLLWLLFYPAVYLSSWRWGMYAGITAAVFSVAMAWGLFVPTVPHSHGALIPTAVFALMCALFCFGHERARRVDQRLKTLFAQSADGIWVADLDGRCRSVNAATCQLLGYARAQLLGQSIFELILPEEVDRLRRTLAALQHGEVQRLEVNLITRAGDHVPVELNTNVLPGEVWVISLRDISQRKAAEDSLLRMRAELYEAQRLGKIGNWKWNRQTDELVWSPELYRIYHQDPSKPPPTVHMLEQLYTPASRQARAQSLEQALQTGLPYEAERELVLPNGEHRWLFVTTEGLCEPDGRIVHLRGTAQDITERKQVELALIESRRELRDVAAHREQEREQERKAIAREIHDELGQLLAAMRMDVSQLRQHCTEGHPANPLLTDLNKLVERTFEVVRSLATSLRPTALDLGLVDALEWLVEDFSLRWEIPCAFQLEGEPYELDDMHATAIFRVVQESLTNIAKHAQASQVHIALRFEPSQV